MPELVRGTVIADRYVVSQIVRPWFAEHPTLGSVCVAVDAILDQQVSLYVASSDHSEPLLDAGRRGSLLTDPRIPAILDVGTSQGFNFVACERIAGTPLSALLAQSPLPAEAARAVAGEIATALVHAAKRHLHHLCLGPESVLITDDNEVVVRGLAIDASVASQVYDWNPDELSFEEKLREDALSVVRILYACLTGRWPGDRPRAGIPASGRKNSRLAPADAFVSDLPDDLDAFVSGVVGEIEPGPRSPSEIVRYLGDWTVSSLSSIVHTSDSEPEGASEGTASPVLTQAARPSPTTEPVAGDHTEGTSSSGRRASPAQLQAALTRAGLTRPGVHGAAAGIVDNPTAFPFDDRMRMRQASRFPVAVSDTAVYDVEAAEADSAAATDFSALERDDNLTAPILNRDELLSSPQAGSSTPDDAVAADEPDSGLDSPNDGADDDQSWFLGGMFQTREQRFEQQQAEYAREAQLREEAFARAKARERAELAAQEQQSQASAAARARALSESEQSDPDFAGSEEEVPDWLNESAADAGSSRAAQPESDSTITVKHAESTAPPPQTERAARAGSAPGSGASRDAGSSSGRSSSSSSSPASSPPRSSQSKSTNPRQVKKTATNAAAGTAAVGGATASAAQRPSPSNSAASTQRGGAAGRAPRASANIPAASAQSDAGGTPKKRRGVGVAATIVVLAVVAALIGFFVVKPQLGTSTADSPPPAQTTSALDTSVSPTASSAPPVAKSIKAIDPEGDGTENNARAKNLLASSGVWSTDRYNSTSFGNLKKGVGVVVTLEKKATVRQLSVVSAAAGGSFDVRIGTSNSVSKATTVGTGSFKDGETVVDLDDGAEGTKVFLWITELPPGPTGFRAELSSLKLS